MQTTYLVAVSALLLVAGRAEAADLPVKPALHRSAAKDTIPIRSRERVSKRVVVWPTDWWKDLGMHTGSVTKTNR